MRSTLWLWSLKIVRTAIIRWEHLIRIPKLCQTSRRAYHRLLAYPVYPVSHRRGDGGACAGANSPPGVVLVLWRGGAESVTSLEPNDVTRGHAPGSITLSPPPLPPPPVCVPVTLPKVMAAGRENCARSSSVDGRNGKIKYENFVFSVTPTNPPEFFS